MPGRRVVSSALMTMVMAGQPQAAIKTWKDLNHRCYGQALGHGPAPGQGLGFGLTGMHEVMWPLGQAAIALGNRSVLLEIMQLPPTTTGQGQDKSSGSSEVHKDGFIDGGDDNDALAAALLLSSTPSTPSTPSVSTPPHPLLFSPESAATGICWMLSQGRLDLALTLWQGHCNNYHNHNHTSSNNISNNITTTATNNNNNNNSSSSSSNSNRSLSLVLDMVCRSALLRSSPAYHHLNHYHDNISNTSTSSSRSSSSNNNNTNTNSNDSFVAASADFCAHLLLQPSTTTGAPLLLTTVPGLSDRFVLKSFGCCTSSQTNNQSIHINQSTKS